MNLYSLGGSTYLGNPLPVGAHVAVFDPQGVRCGEFVVTTAGRYGIVPCYGDDLETPAVDEGASPGDILHFTIKGVTAETEAIAHWGVPVPATTTIIWQDQDRWEVDLHAWLALEVTHTLTSSANPSDVGQPVTFATMVTGSGPDGETPTGHIQFWIDGTASGGPVALSNGQAAFSTADLVTGTHTISATYGGDGAFGPSTANLSQNVLIHAQPTNRWVDFWSTASTYMGVPVPVGMQVVVFDPQGVQCGDVTVTIPGWYGVMPCYGDDQSAPGDQGAVLGDILHFTINGRAAQTEVISMNFTPMAPDTVVIWSPIQWQVNLHVPSDVAPTAVTDLQASKSGTNVVLGWTDVGGTAHHYEVWRGSTPYFTPDTAEGALIAANVQHDDTGAVSFVDEASHLGNTAIEDYYVVLAVDITGQKSLVSNRVGAFDFGLQPGTGP